MTKFSNLSVILNLFQNLSMVATKLGYETLSFNFINMYKIEKCQKVKVDQGFFYLGPSNKERSVGYLE